MQNKTSPGLSMYFDQKLVEKFAALEQNEKNYQVANIIDLIVQQEFDNKSLKLVAELGGGAHPDRYNWLFTHLIDNQGCIDWVDISDYMLQEAVKYLGKNYLHDRKKVIIFIKADINNYLMHKADNSLDLCIMKYTIDHIADIPVLFSLFSKKIRPGGKVIATVGFLNPELKSISTNARFLFNGEEFPENKTKTLHDGDTFTVKFFNESGKPGKGYLVGAETTKYFHSTQKLIDSAKSANLEIYVGDWKQYFKGQTNISLAQDIVVLSKNF